jgi:hypothetical protein
MQTIIEKIDQAIKDGAKTIIITPVDFTKWTVKQFNIYPDEHTETPCIAWLKGIEGDIEFVRTVDIPEGSIYTCNAVLKRI